MWRCTNNCLLDSGSKWIQAVLWGKKKLVFMLIAMLQNYGVFS